MILIIIQGWFLIIKSFKGIYIYLDILGLKYVFISFNYIITIARQMFLDFYAYIIGAPLGYLIVFCWVFTLFMGLIFIIYLKVIYFKRLSQKIHFSYYLRLLFFKRLFIFIYIRIYIG